MRLMMTGSTIDYYNSHAEEYAQRTRSVSLQEEQRRFLQYLPSFPHVLDAGCGAGRDSKYFIETGCRVVSIDASEMMVKLTTEYTGKDAIQMRFEEMDYCSMFDGIWASASLLHVSKEDLPGVMKRIHRALKPDGYIMLSFKHGQGEEIFHDGRYFLLQDERSLTDLLSQTGFIPVEMWINPPKNNQFLKDWLNVIAQRIDFF